jgi:recyclin-1
MFETNMDEYLDEELEYAKSAFDQICRAWEKKVCYIFLLGPNLSDCPRQTSLNATTPATPQVTRFLSSHNPAQVKRTVLASFTDVLLLPVTIVPRAAGAVGAGLATAGGAAVQGISMLNPQRWGGGGGTSSATGRLGGYNGAGRDLDDAVVFELGDDPDEEDEKMQHGRHPSNLSVGS